MKLLENKVAIITGSGRGIGRATAEVFAEHGASLVLNATKEDTVKAAADLVKAKGAKCVCVVGDVSADGMPEKIVQAAISNFGTLDILVNNAGVAGDNPGSVFDMRADDWDRVMKVNVDAVLKMSLQAVKHFQKQKRGKIVNVSSRGGKIPRAHMMPHYPVSKAAVLQLTRWFAKKFGPDNIHVNAVLPGPIKTDMTVDWTDAVRNKVLSELALGRQGDPREVGNVILFLASYLSDYVTGSGIDVSGGGIMD